jgi:acyl transferase domain-containing protein
MRPPGGMFLDGIDLARFDAAFFEISGVEAIAMDPNQRQMLEVVVEGLENAGISLEQLSEAPIACLVGSYASGKSLGSLIFFVSRKLEH